MAANSNLTYDFTGKVALITGAGSGIGRATALAFAESGARVIVSDVSGETGEATAAMIRDAGGDARFVRCNVANAEEVAALVAAAIDTYGSIDCAFNNAGVVATSGIVDLLEEDWDRVIDINLKGVWLCMKYQIPQMLKQGGGSIVNTASVYGIRSSQAVAYCASKHGVIALTEAAAVAYAEQGVRVNAVCPGPIMTPMLERLMQTTPGFRDQLLAGVPERRIGTPQDVAQAIMFLSSGQAAYITGQALAIDGGWVTQ